MSLSGSSPPLVSIGGTATPFLPAVDYKSFFKYNLTYECQRHSNKTRRRKSARFVNFNQYHGMVRLGQLFCRTGHHLQIHTDGRINGTKRDDSRFGVLEFMSVAFGLVTIRGKASDRFLCMNKKGRLEGRKTASNECVFMERMLENYYNTYSSCAHRTPPRRRGAKKEKRWFIALSRRGKPRNGRNSRRKRRKYTHFLVLHLDYDDYSEFSRIRGTSSTPESGVATSVRRPGQRRKKNRRRKGRRKSKWGIEEYTKNYVRPDFDHLRSLYEKGKSQSDINSALNPSRGYSRQSYRPVQAKYSRGNRKRRRFLP